MCTRQALVVIQTPFFFCCITRHDVGRNEATVEARSEDVRRRYVEYGRVLHQFSVHRNLRAEMRLLFPGTLPSRVIIIVIILAGEHKAG